jgi:hypothetical protein
MYLQYKFPIFSILPSGNYRSTSDCSFLTNVPTGQSYRQSGAWVSLDKNGGNNLVGYGFTGYSTFSCSDSSASLIPVKTVEGYDICTRSGYPTRIYIREGNYGLVYDSSQGSSAITSCSGSCIPSCLNKQCGDDGCGGSCGTCDSGNVCNTNQCVPVTTDCSVGQKQCLSSTTYRTCSSTGSWSGTLSCSSGTTCTDGLCSSGTISCNTEADTDCDDTVSRAELGVSISDWINGEISRDKLGEIIIAWVGAN